MANRCHFQCCLQVCLQLLPSHGPGCHELKIFSVKIMQPIAKKGKSWIKIPKLNLPNHNHRKERHKNLPTWPFSGLILARDPRTHPFFSIPWKTTEEELKQHFSKFGNIVFANIKKDPETGNSRGFGFIRFENYESQKKAMEEATHEIDGRAVVLRLTKKVFNQPLIRPRDPRTA